MATKKKQKKTTAKKKDLKATTYGIDGKKAGTVNLPEDVFGLPWKNDLVHQTIVAQQANARKPVAHAADRSEKRGGGRKPWRQKGTGRARHGSIRSPIWRGGGVTHGPLKTKKYGKKVNKKMRTKALCVALSKKLADEEILFVESFGVGAPKTKEAKGIIESLAGVKNFDELSTKKHNTALIALPENDTDVKRAFSNFGNVTVAEIRNLNPVDVLTYKYLIVANPEASLETLKKRLA